MKKLIFVTLFLFIIEFLIGNYFKFPISSIIIYLWVPTACLMYGLFYWFRNKYFFRDPERNPPTQENIIVSPADGRVMYIYPVKNGDVVSNKNGENIKISEISKTELSNKDGWLVGIYMSPFDVHYNYSPISGKVKSVFHFQTGINLPMVDLWEYINFTLIRRAINLFSRKFHFINERMTIEIKNDTFACVVILIADKFVNKITKYFDTNDELKIGQKISFIERGSQADLFIPVKKLNFEVKVGQQVYGCKTVIAKYEYINQVTN